MPGGVGALLCVLLSVCLTACGTGAAVSPPNTTSAVASPSPASSGPVEATTLLTDSIVNGGYAFLYAGGKQGHFKAQRLDLTIQPGANSGDTAAKVGSGVAPFGLVDTFAVVTAVSKGAKIKSVANWFQKHTGGMCGIEEKHAFRTYKDFEGAMIGDTGTGYYQFIPQLMRDSGTDPDKIDLIKMDRNAANAALLNQQIDGTTCGSYTNATRAAAAAKLGLHVSFFPFADNGFDKLGTAVVVNSDVLSKQPDLVQRFVDAFARSLVWSAQNPEQAMKDFVEANPEQDGPVELGNLKGGFPFYLDKPHAADNGMFVFPQSTIESTVDYANKSQTPNLTVKPDDVYTNQFALKIPPELRLAKIPGVN
jgi:NitT/TauT family transport system substrate-binding protein